MKVNDALVGLHIKKDSKITIPSIDSEINFIKQKLSLNNLNAYNQMEIGIKGKEIVISSKITYLNDPKVLTKEQEERLIAIKQSSFLNGKADVNIESLTDSLLSLRSLVNSEKDFQMLLKGKLMRSPECASVFSESNHAGTQRADVVAIFYHMVELLELKYAETQVLARMRQDDAVEQLKKYENNFKSITDLKRIKTGAMTFNGEESSSEILLFKEGEFIADRTSEEESSREESSNYRESSLDSLAEFLARKDLRKNQLKEELEKLRREPTEGYNLLETNRLEEQVKILELEIEIAQKEVLVKIYVNKIIKVKKSLKELEEDNKKAIKRFDEEKGHLKSLGSQQAETGLEEDRKKWEIEAKGKEEEIRKKLKELEKELKNHLAKLINRTGEIKQIVENLDTTEELVGYKAKEGLFEVLKGIQEEAEEFKKLIPSEPEEGISQAGSSGQAAQVALGITFGAAAGLATLGGTIRVGAGVAGGSASTAKQETANLPKQEIKKEKGIAGQEIKGANKPIQVKRVGINIRSKNPKKSRICLEATRRRRDIKIDENSVEFLLDSQKNFSRTREKIRRLLGSGADIRILGPTWYGQLMSADRIETEKTLYVEKILYQGFLLGNETVCFSTLDKMNHFLSRDHETFPPSVHELSKFCECQQKLFQETSVASQIYGSNYTIEELRQYLLMQPSSNWAKQLWIGEQKIFIRLLDNVYSYLDSKNIYINHINKVQDLYQVIRLVDDHYRHDNSSYRIENIDIIQETQTFHNIINQMPIFEVERDQLQNQDESLGKFDIDGKLVSRVMLYNLGLEVKNENGSLWNPFDREFGEELNADKFRHLLEEDKLRISARNYIKILHQIEVFPNDSLQAFLWLSQLPFKEESGEKIEKIFQIKALIHQITNTLPTVLLRYQIRFIRETNLLFFSKLPFPTIATVKLDKNSTILENYTSKWLNQVVMPVSLRTIEVKLSPTSPDDLCFVVSPNVLELQHLPPGSSFVVLKDYNKDISHQKVVMKDAEQRLWWPLIKKLGSSGPRLIPFHYMEPIHLNICIFAEQLQEKATIATYADSELIALWKGNDLLFIQDKNSSGELESLKGLIFKQFFLEPEKWQSLEIYIIGTGKHLTFNDIKEQAKLAVECESFLKERRDKFTIHLNQDGFPLAKLFRISQMEWGQRLADPKKGFKLIAFMAFVIAENHHINPNNDYKLSNFLGFNTEADMLNFMNEYLKYDPTFTVIQNGLQLEDNYLSQINTPDNLLLEESAWLIMRAFLRKHVAPRKYIRLEDLNTCFKILLPPVLITKVYMEFFDRLRIENSHYSNELLNHMNENYNGHLNENYLKIKAFIRSTKESDVLVNLMNFHIGKSYSLLNPGCCTKALSLNSCVRTTPITFFSSKGKWVNLVRKNESAYLILKPQDNELMRVLQEDEYAYVEELQECLSDRVQGLSQGNGTSSK